MINKQDSIGSNFLYSWTKDYVDLYFQKETIKNQNIGPDSNIENNQGYKEWKDCYKQMVIKDEPQALQTSFTKIKQKQFNQAYFLDFIGYQGNFYLSILFYFVAENILNNQYDSFSNFLLILGIIALQFIKMIAHLHSENKFRQLGEVMYRHVATAIIQKSMKCSILCNKQFTTSEISKFMHLDCQKLLLYNYWKSTAIFNMIGLIVNSVIVIFLTGWAGLIGIITLYICISVRLFLNEKWNELQESLSQKSNDRIKTTIDIFGIIKFIKVNAYQLIYFNKIQECRQKQIERLQSKFCFELLPLLMVMISVKLAILIIGLTWIGFNHQFNAALMLGVSLAFNYSNLVITLMNITLIKNTNISLNQISDYLKTEEMDITHIQRQKSTLDEAIKISGTFYWKSQNSKEFITQENWHLKNIQLNIQKGQLVAVIGRYGSGKSSIVNAILGEMMHEGDASVIINGSLAYVSQKSWIMNASIRNNILFGRTFDSDLYNKVIYYSCLKTDLDILEAGDQTIIGERGCTLSGGQKVRVSLARALYSQAQIIILDDILSALDAHIGAFIFTETLKNYKKGTTILLITHSLSFTKYTDKIVIIEEGRILEQGSYQKLKNNSILMTIQTAGLKNHNGQKYQIMKQSESPFSKFDVNDSESIISEYTAFKQYLQLNGGCLFKIISTGYMLLLGISTAMGLIWLNIWANASNFHETYFVYIYFVLMIVCSILAILMARILHKSQIFTTVHSGMIRSLLFAPLSYFQKTPMDKIINRLSSDLNTNDRTIVTDYFCCSTNFGVCLSYVFCIMVVFVIYNDPLLILISMCYFGIIAYVYYKFLVTCRELHHLEEAAKIPINSTFSETLSGLSTIRAYGAENQTKSACFQNISLLGRVVVVTAGVDSWLKFILTFCFAVYSIFIFALLYYRNYQTSYDILLLFNVLAINEFFQRANMSLSDFLTRLHSLGRCQQLSNIEPEASYKNQQQNLPELNLLTNNNPPLFKRGEIKFVNFSVSYRPELGKVLKNIGLTIRAGEKVGVVGRTGSGKSTLLLSLLRILEAGEGHIEIDGQDTSKISLQVLRSNMNVILQDHFLSAGTIRENVNPTCNCSDTDIIKVLTLCGLWDDLIKRDGLNTEVAEGGDNFSAGEKQLLAIARAMLTPKQIVLIDEATANIDMHSDQLVQDLMNKQFRNCTVLTIAHRITSVANSDRILVLQKGEVAEFDTPQRLLMNSSSIFSQLYAQSGKKIN